MKNKTMHEMNEQFKDCPVQVNEYEVDGRIYRVTSHFIGEKDINDVMYNYAVNRAAWSYSNSRTAIIFFQKAIDFNDILPIMSVSVKVALEERSY